jgi:glycosyltransferase involved in cell wall biosynthesis
VDFGVSVQKILEQISDLYKEAILLIKLGVSENLSVAVVIPCYRVKNSIINLIESITPAVSYIIVIDDGCPDGTGKFVESKIQDERVTVLFNNENLGVGGAVKTGYRFALSVNADIIVKLDGDGQMDPTLVPTLLEPIRDHRADYTKGNRFYNIENVKNMPKLRIFGNLILSFFAKFSTGYWRIFDPNNGFTAVTSSALRQLDLEKIDNRYFFESDMLFRLNLARAVVIDVPMEAKYGSEISNLSVKRAASEFPMKHTRNFFKRVAYTYYLRDFTLASLELPIGLGLTSFGVTSGLFNFIQSQNLNQETAPGTLILVSMSILVGIQLILGFFAYDMDSSPSNPISKTL